MKYAQLIGSTCIALGFMIMIGTAGSSDYIEQCRAAADCIAEVGPSDLNVFVNLVIGASLIVFGVVAIKFQD